MSSPARQVIAPLRSEAGSEGKPGAWRRRLLVMFWAGVAALSAAGVIAWQALNSLISMPLL